MTVFTVIISNVMTGRVERRVAMSRAEAERLTAPFPVCGRKDGGWRVEVVRRDLCELGETELRAVLDGMSVAELETLASDMGGA